MRISMLLASLAAIAAIGSIAWTKAENRGPEKTIVGYITDNMCGADHSAMKMGDDKECTIKCVEGGAKYALADHAHNVVYTIDEAAQQKAREFAGQKVKITGRVDAKAKTIQVTKIEATK